MFSQGNTNSPFRSMNQQNSFGTPQQQQQSSPFSQQQQTSSSAFNSTSSGYYGNQSSSFSGPQFGGGSGNTNGGFNGNSSGYGNQFGGGGGGNVNAGSNGGAYGSPFSQNNGMHSSGGQSSAGTPNFGEAKKRNYLPGYLSGGAAGQAESTPPQSMNNDSWDSPARKASLSSSPATRFGPGGGSLFGGRDNTPSKSPKFTPYTAPARGHAYRAEMEEDAPPIASLNEYEANDQHEQSFGGFRQPEQSTNSPFSNPPPSLHASPASSTTYAVNVFGFPSSALDLVLDYFAQFGEIVSKTPSTEGGNWVTIEYSQPWSAARAARKNGEILGGVLMIGVKAIDEDDLKRALSASEGGGSGGESSLVPTPSGTGTATPRPHASTTSQSGVGKPVQVFGVQSAFKVAPTPPRKGFLGLGGGTPQQASTSTGGGGGGGEQHASLFAEKSRQATMQQQQGHGQKGVLGKVSDLVFGW